jgi:hypothetical protein
MPDEPDHKDNRVDLAMLPLRPGDLGELRRQGFISREVRDGKVYYKLRFRRDGRQAVIGLGTDQKLAEGIGDELTRLQAKRQRDLDVKRLSREARGLLRRSKQDLEAALRDAGFRFHGYEIRKQRTSTEPGVVPAG